MTGVAEPARVHHPHPGEEAGDLAHLHALASSSSPQTSTSSSSSWSQPAEVGAAHGVEAGDDPAAGRAARRPAPPPSPRRPPPPPGPARGRSAPAPRCSPPACPASGPARSGRSARLCLVGHGEDGQVRRAAAPRRWRPREPAPPPSAAEALGDLGSPLLGARAGRGSRSPPAGQPAPGAAPGPDRGGRCRRSGRSSGACPPVYGRRRVRGGGGGARLRVDRHAHGSRPSSRGSVRMGTPSGPRARVEGVRQMEFRRVGESGLEVSVVGVGCNQFGRRVDATGVARIVHAALDAGVTLFDTADAYGGGEFERLLGAALRGNRNAAIVATKVGGQMGEGPYTLGGLAASHPRRRGEQPAPAGDRLDRPLPGPLPRHRHPHRGDPLCPRRSGPRGQGALHRLLQLQRAGRSPTPIGPRTSTISAASSAPRTSTACSTGRRRRRWYPPASTSAWG